MAIATSTYDYIEKFIDRIDTDNWYLFFKGCPYSYRKELFQILQKANIEIDPRHEVCYSIIINNGYQTITTYAYDIDEKYFLCMNGNTNTMGTTQKLLFKDFNAAIKFLYKYAPVANLAFIKTDTICWDLWTEVDTNIEKAYIHVQQIDYLERKQGVKFGINCN